MLKNKPYNMYVVGGSRSYFETKNKPRKPHSLKKLTLRPLACKRGLAPASPDPPAAPCIPNNADSALKKTPSGCPLLVPTWFSWFYFIFFYFMYFWRGVKELFHFLPLWWQRVFRLFETKPQCPSVPSDCRTIPGSSPLLWTESFRSTGQKPNGMIRFPNANTKKQRLPDGFKVEVQ